MHRKPPSQDFADSRGPCLLGEIVSRHLHGAALRAITSFLTPRTGPTVA